MKIVFMPSELGRPGVNTIFTGCSVLALDYWQIRDCKVATYYAAHKPVATNERGTAAE